MGNFLKFILLILFFPTMVFAGNNTTNLNLYKPIVGEVGWGDYVNSNFDIVDGAIHSLNTNTFNKTRGSWKVFYSNGTGDIIELPLGNSGYLKSNGNSSAPSFSAVTGNGTGNVTQEDSVTENNFVLWSSDGVVKDGGVSNATFLTSMNLSGNTTDDLSEGSTNKYANVTKENHGEEAYGWGNHSLAGYSTPNWTQNNNGGGYNLSNVTNLTVNDTITSSIMHPNSHLEMHEGAAPATPDADHTRIYAEDKNGFTILKVIDSTGDTLQFLRDNVMIIKNGNGFTLTKGMAVYVNGATGNVPNALPASNNVSATLPAIGIVYSSITDGSFGRVMIYGLLSNINTDSWNEGDALYVGYNGSLVNVTPSYPNAIQRVGIVLVKGVGNGAIEVDTQAVISTDGVPYTGAADDVNLGAYNITTTGEITAGYFIGDGSQLTSLPGGGNASINATTDGNFTIGNGTTYLIDSGYNAASFAKRSETMNNTELLALANLTNYYNITTLNGLSNLTNYYNITTLNGLSNLTNYFNVTTLLGLTNLTNYFNVTTLLALQNLTNYFNVTATLALDNMTNYFNKTVTESTFLNLSSTTKNITVLNITSINSNSTSYTGTYGNLTNVKATAVTATYVNASVTPFIIQFTVDEPDILSNATGLTTTGRMIWTNMEASRNYTITQVSSIADVDNYVFSLYKSTNFTNCTNESITVLQNITVADNGEGLFYNNTTSFVNATIEPGKHLIFHSGTAVNITNVHIIIKGNFS